MGLGQNPDGIATMGAVRVDGVSTAEVMGYDGVGGGEEYFFATKRRSPVD